MAEKKNNKKTFKKMGATFLAGVLPGLAAVFKGFSYSFGSLNFLNFFYLGYVQLSLAAFSGPFLPFVFCLGVSIILITLGMEGRSLFKTLRKKIDKKMGIERTEEETPDLFSQQKQQQEIEPWKQSTYEFIGSSAKVAGMVIPALAGAAKGATSAVGTMGLLLGCYSLVHQVSFTLGVGSLIALGPPGIAILSLGLIAGIAIASVSWGKEGRSFYALTERFSNWLTGQKTEQEEEPKDKKKKEEKPAFRKAPTKQDKETLNPCNQRNSQEFYNWQEVKNKAKTQRTSSPSHAFPSRRSRYRAAGHEHEQERSRPTLRTFG